MTIAASAPLPFMTGFVHNRGQLTITGYGFSNASTLFMPADSTFVSLVEGYYDQMQSIVFSIQVPATSVLILQTGIGRSNQLGPFTVNGTVEGITYTGTTVTISGYGFKPDSRVIITDSKNVMIGSEIMATFQDLMNRTQILTFSMSPTIPAPAFPPTPPPTEPPTPPPTEPPTIPPIPTMPPQIESTTTTTTSQTVVTQTTEQCAVTQTVTNLCPIMPPICTQTIIGDTPAAASADSTATTSAHQRAATTMESFRNSLRNKWTKHVTARRIRSLWNDYTKVAEIKILALLDTLNTSENKRVLLRVISAIGENIDNKLEIGRLEGFKKMLVLMHNDKELTQEILKTIKHFLDIKQTAVSTDEELMKLINMKKSLSVSSISEFARLKIGTAVSEGFKVIVGEFQKVFSPNDADMASFHPRVRALSIDKAASASAASASIDSSFIPESDLVNAELLVSGTGESLATTTPPPAASDEEEILKEFMRVQGALASLANSIQEAALVVQLDLLETISKLLYNNRANQTEFRNMDGYSILIHLFDNVQDFSTAEGCDFLDDCFSLIFVIILDGNTSRRVANVDALAFLFKILANSTQTEVRLQTLTCIQDLISINPLNITNVKQIGEK
eukprot:gene14974-17708_t